VLYSRPTRSGGGGGGGSSSSSSSSRSSSIDGDGILKSNIT